MKALSKEIEFTDVNDIWDYIILLKKESENQKKQGSLFTTLNNVFEQLPFFCCYNNILNEECQEDISKYVYCTYTNTPAYSASYNDTPATWVEKYYIIKQALGIREKKLTENMKNANVK